MWIEVACPGAAIVLLFTLFCALIYDWIKYGGPDDDA